MHQGDHVEMDQHPDRDRDQIAHIGACHQHIKKAWSQGAANGIEKLPPSTEALDQGLNILLQSDFRSLFSDLSVHKYAILGALDMLVPKSIEGWYQAHNTQTTLLRTGHLPFLDENFILPRDI